MNFSIRKDESQPIYFKLNIKFFSDSQLTFTIVPQREYRLYNLTRGTFYTINSGDNSVLIYPTLDNNPVNTINYFFLDSYENHMDFTIEICNDDLIEQDPEYIQIVMSRMRTTNNNYEGVNYDDPINYKFADIVYQSLDNDSPFLVSFDNKDIIISEDLNSSSQLVNIPVTILKADSLTNGSFKINYIITNQNFNSYYPAQFGTQFYYDTTHVYTYNNTDNTHLNIPILFYPDIDDPKSYYIELEFIALTNSRSVEYKKCRLLYNNTMQQIVEVYFDKSSYSVKTKEESISESIFQSILFSVHKSHYIDAKYKFRLTSYSTSSRTNLESSFRQYQINQTIIPSNNTDYTTNYFTSSASNLTDTFTISTTSNPSNGLNDYLRLELVSMESIDNNFKIVPIIDVSPLAHYSSIDYSVLDSNDRIIDLYFDKTSYQNTRIETFGDQYLNQSIVIGRNSILPDGIGCVKVVFDLKVTSNTDSNFTSLQSSNRSYRIKTYNNTTKEFDTVLSEGFTSYTEPDLYFDFHQTELYIDFTSISDNLSEPKDYIRFEIVNVRFILLDRINYTYNLLNSGYKYSDIVSIIRDDTRIPVEIYFDKSLSMKSIKEYFSESTLNDYLITIKKYDPTNTANIYFYLYYIGSPIRNYDIVYNNIVYDDVQSLRIDMSANQDTVQVYLRLRNPNQIIDNYIDNFGLTFYNATALSGTYEYNLSLRTNLNSYQYDKIEFEINDDTFIGFNYLVDNGGNKIPFTYDLSNEYISLPLRFLNSSYINNQNVLQYKLSITGSDSVYNLDYYRDSNQIYTASNTTANFTAQNSLRLLYPNVKRTRDFYIDFLVNPYLNTKTQSPYSSSRILVKYNKTISLKYQNGDRSKDIPVTYQSKYLKENDQDYIVTVDGNFYTFFNLRSEYTVTFNIPFSGQKPVYSNVNGKKYVGIVQNLPSGYNYKVYELFSLIEVNETSSVNFIFDNDTSNETVLTSFCRFETLYIIRRNLITSIKSLKCINLITREMISFVLNDSNNYHNSFVPESINHTIVMYENGIKIFDINSKSFIKTILTTSFNTMKWFEIPPKKKLYFYSDTNTIKVFDLVSLSFISDIVLNVSNLYWLSYDSRTDTIFCLDGSVIKVYDNNFNIIPNLSLNIVSDDARNIKLRYDGFVYHRKDSYNSSKLFILYDSVLEYFHNIGNLYPN